MWTVKPHRVNVNFNTNWVFVQYFHKNHRKTQNNPRPTLIFAIKIFSRLILRRGHCKRSKRILKGGPLMNINENKMPFDEGIFIRGPPRQQPYRISSGAPSRGARYWHVWRSDYWHGKIRDKCAFDVGIFVSGGPCKVCWGTRCHFSVQSVFIVLQQFVS